MGFPALAHGLQEARPPVSHDPIVLEAECEQDDVRSCLMLGLLLFTGDEVPLDEERAAHYFGRACELGHPTACVMQQRSAARGFGLSPPVEPEDEI